MLRAQALAFSRSSTSTASSLRQAGRTPPACLNAFVCKTHFVLRYNVAASLRLRCSCMKFAEESPQLTAEGSLLKNAGMIGAATAISKIFGLVRELVLAAVFGVGPVVDALGYASIIPGFFIAVLGGINGPIHLSTTSTLSKVSKEKSDYLFGETSRAALLLTSGLSVILFVLAATIIDISAPGLKSVDTCTRTLAILQLRIMAPSIIFSTLVGIGYGRLSSLGVYGVPSLSPALTSVLVIFAAAVYRLYSHGFSNQQHGIFFAGAILLSLAFTLGSLAQWLFLRAQTPSALRFSWKSSWFSEDVNQVFQLMLPAAVGSGMLQIATYTDLYFASYFPQATASLGYANLLVMAPLGVISSAILVPIVPIFARLSEPSKWGELRNFICQSLLLCLLFMLPMTAIMLPLAKPIVRLLFQRCAFGTSAVEAVSSHVIYYVLGSTCYLIRDLLVRVFYALGDTQTPFKLSMAAILANAVLDWLFIRHAGFGPQGLVLATTLVNVLVALGLLQLLARRLKGLGLRRLLQPTGELVTAAALSSCVTGVSCTIIVARCNSKLYWFKDLACIGLSSLLGCTAFFALACLLLGDELQSLWKLLKLH